MCLFPDDKFDGIEFGQTQSARRANTMDGVSQRLIQDVSDHS